jgi:DNA-binding NarL/FixJ family response regulator
MVVALVGDRGRPRAGVLSRREEEVLRLIAHGYTQKEIAKKMAISPTTVETYSARIREKLDLRERSDLVRYAMTRGIVRETVDQDDAA